MAITSSVQLSKQTQENVVNYLQHIYRRFDITTARDRYERVDKAIQLESDLRRDTVEDYFDDIEQPLIEGPVSTISNFLIDTFVASPSIFEVVTSKTELTQIARQMNLVNMENSQSTAWARELILYFRDLPKYNFGGIEVKWNVQDTTEVTTDVTGDTRTGAAVSVVQREGNELKRLDPYNTFFDTTVDINKVHKEGEFCGHVERMSMIKLSTLINNLKAGRGAHVLNEDEVWNHGSTNGVHWHNPNVVPDRDLDSSNNGWLGFFGHTPDRKGQRNTLNFHYEVTTLYARIIPSMFGMKVPASNKVQIWKFIVVGWNTVIYAEKQTNIHNNLPTVLTQIDEQGINTQVKSKAEKLIPIQNLSTKYYDIRMAGLVRAVSDRLLYDKTRINKADIDNDNPKAKIAVKPDILKGGIANAVQRIDYSDTMGSSFLNELNFLDSRANKLAGLNNPQQGQLQRGNRTLGEFNEVMQNADADLRTWGKLVETQGMVPIKTMIKANILQYQPQMKITDPTSGEQVDITPPEIRSAMLDFKVADGLVTREALLDLPTARTAMEMILQVPALQQTYGAALPSLVEKIFSSIGFDLQAVRQEANAAMQGQQPQAAPPAQQGGDENAQ